MPENYIGGRKIPGSFQHLRADLNELHRHYHGPINKKHGFKPFREMNIREKTQFFSTALLVLTTQGNGLEEFIDLLDGSPNHSRTSHNDGLYSSNFDSNHLNSPLVAPLATENIAAGNRVVAGNDNLQLIANRIAIYASDLTYRTRFNSEESMDEQYYDTPKALVDEAVRIAGLSNKNLKIEGMHQLFAVQALRNAWRGNFRVDQLYKEIWLNIVRNEKGQAFRLNADDQTGEINATLLSNKQAKKLVASFEEEGPKMQNNEIKLNDLPDNTSNDAETLTATAYSPAPAETSTPLPMDPESPLFQDIEEVKNLAIESAKSTDFKVVDSNSINLTPEDQKMIEEFQNSQENVYGGNAEFTTHTQIIQAESTDAQTSIITTGDFAFNTLRFTDGNTAITLQYRINSGTIENAALYLTEEKIVNGKTVRTFFARPADPEVPSFPAVFAVYDSPTARKPRALYIYQTGTSGNFMLPLEGEAQDFEVYAGLSPGLVLSDSAPDSASPPTPTTVPPTEIPMPTLSPEEQRELEFGKFVPELEKCVLKEQGNLHMAGYVSSEVDMADLRLHSTGKTETERISFGTDNQGNEIFKNITKLQVVCRDSNLNIQTPMWLVLGSDSFGKNGNGLNTFWIRLEGGTLQGIEAVPLEVALSQITDGLEIRIKIPLEESPILRDNDWPDGTSNHLANEAIRRAAENKDQIDLIINGSSATKDDVKLWPALIEIGPFSDS